MQRSSSKRKKLHERNNTMSRLKQEARMKQAGENAVKIEASSTPATQDGEVNIRIKPFRIPELFIDMPENATLSSLKRAVLEKVTAMIQDGLEDGLVVNGRNVRDDSRAFVETGNACGEKLDDDSLSFSSEPSTPKYESPPQPLATLPPLPTSADSAMVSSKPETNESLLPVDSPTKSSPAASKSTALVLHSGGSPTQRRIRRPFSITEVEALVNAVEIFGTGRWIDVKLLAFSDAEHRTYVDLKDKWKTLVRTAQISPQQRRGEQVPQVLLDRVLRIHAFWIQQSHSKSSSPVTSPAP